MVNKKLMILALAAALIIVFAIIMIFYFENKGKTEEKKGEDQLYCNSDSDCIRAECCHANSCVNIKNKMSCAGIFCTQSCEPGTLDCGQGSCLCVNNKCKAVFK